MIRPARGEREWIGYAYETRVAVRDWAAQHRHTNPHHTTETFRRGDGQTQSHCFTCRELDPDNPTD